MDYWEHACDWEDDWENTIIPDLMIPDLMVSIESREHERKMLEERKKMEEADAALTEAMFSSEKKEQTNSEYYFKPIIKREKPKDFEKRKIELMEKQRQLAQKKREEKAQNIRLIEIYGEAEIDKYDEIYGNIANKYMK